MFTKTAAVFMFRNGKLVFEQVTISGRRQWAVEKAARYMEIDARIVKHGFAQKIGDVYAK